MNESYHNQTPILILLIVVLMVSVCFNIYQFYYIHTTLDSLQNMVHHLLNLITVGN